MTNGYKEAKHKNTTIRFYPEKHIYVDPKTNELYKSVTQLLHNWTAPFDREGISKKTAEKRGVSQESLLKQWDEKAKFSQQLGTKCHGFAECKLLGLDLSDQFKPQTDYEKDCAKLIETAIDKLNQKYKLIECEKIVFSPKYKAAGSIDLLMSSDGAVVLLDWKTNEEIKRKNPWAKMKGDLEHLESCNYNEYALQLNCYRKILLTEGYFDCDIRMGLIHINPQIGIDWIKIPVMDTESEVVLSRKKLDTNPDF